MRLIDQPSVLEWPEFQQATQRHQKMIPTQRRMEFATAMLAARHWHTMPENVKPTTVITTQDGITLHPGDIEAILRGPS